MELQGGVVIFAEYFVVQHDVVVELVAVLDHHEHVLPDTLLYGLDGTALLRHDLHGYFPLLEGHRPLEEVEVALVGVLEAEFHREGLVVLLCDFGVDLLDVPLYLLVYLAILQPHVVDGGEYATWFVLDGCLRLGSQVANAL